MGSDLTPEYAATLRRLSGQEKLESGLALYWFARDLKAAGLREQHPDWPEERIQAEVKGMFLRASP